MDLLTHFLRIIKFGEVRSKMSRRISKQKNILRKFSIQKVKAVLNNRFNAEIKGVYLRFYIFT
jgi:hypothetical protein